MEEYDARIMELFGMVDEVESFNAKAVNMMSGIFDLRVANERTQRLVEKLREKGSTHVGIAVSDTFYGLDQVRKSGIYVSCENLGLEAELSTGVV